MMDTNGNAENETREANDALTKIEVNNFESNKHIKKSPANADDECIRKFTLGDAIIDKRNPFKESYNANGNHSPPPTFDIAQTNQPQVLEIESHTLKDAHVNSENPLQRSLSDDNITTEEVLRQSKYVKTYIKNPDPYFYYDPAVLEHIKRESVQELREKNVKNKLNKPIVEKSLHEHPTGVEIISNKLPYKKCSKPNYPSLSDIKIKVGTEQDSTYLNPTEIKLNVKKFDERVKNIKFSSMDDLDDIEEHLKTRTDLSSEEPLANSNDIHSRMPKNKDLFTSTIKSKSFQKYLMKNGLVLVPHKVLNDAKKESQIPCPPNKYKIDTKPLANKNTVSKEDLSKKTKKPSIFHRFLSKSKTKPKPTASVKQEICDLKSNVRENDTNISNKLLTNKNYNKRKELESKRMQAYQANEENNDCKVYSDSNENIYISRISQDGNNTITDLYNEHENKGNDNKSGHLLRGHESRIQAKPLYRNKNPTLDEPTEVHNTTNNITNAYSTSKYLQNERVNKPLTIDNHETMNRPPLIDRSEMQRKILNTENSGNVKHEVMGSNIQENDSSEGLLIKDTSSSAPAVCVRNTNNFRNEWFQLRDKKLNVDRNLYINILKQNSQNNDNLYEYIALSKQQLDPSKRKYATLNQSNNHFVRNCPQRNTFNGTNLTPMYIQDPRSLIDYRIIQNKNKTSNQNVSIDGSNSSRDIPPGTTLSREEIIARVKQFCRNSIKRKAKKESQNNQHSSDVVSSSNPSPDYYKIYQYSDPALQYPNMNKPIVYANVFKRNSMKPTSYDQEQRSVHSRADTSLDSISRYSSNNTFVDINQHGIQTIRRGYNFGCRSPIELDGSSDFQNHIYCSTLKKNVHTHPSEGLNHNNFKTEELIRMKHHPQYRKEDWQNENKSGGRQMSNDQVSEERRRASRREDPRRHTLGGDMLQYGVVQGQPQQRAMDLEMGMRSQKSKKNQPIRSYAPVNQGPLFDEDPGIMSEVETASTGFRRGGKQRSSLPVVRTPSKTLERPLGLVFLQYRSETKRALLPNEITSIDTVRALFVRSFPRQLTMAYLEGPNVKIYIHDASKDMFYELEDVRLHLREIRDRSVLRLFESNEVAAPQVLPGGPGIPQPLPQAVPLNWDQDQSYFSEPEFDSEYQHQHIHKSKPGKQQPYYIGASQTLPRGMYSDRNKLTVDGYSSSPERGTRGSYEEPYYSQYGTRGNVVAPIIDEENSEAAISEEQYALYGMKMGPGRLPRNANQMYDSARPEDLHRIRVEHMERQLANLTGLVQKALVNQNPQITPTAIPAVNPNYLGVPVKCRANGTGDDIYIREKAPKLGKSSCHKSVSFEKSVSFSDDIQGVPKSHSPQHTADTKPTKPAIKSSTLPRTSSQERDRLKPPPPPKPIALTQAGISYRADIALAPEVYNQLRGLQKKAKDLRMEVRTLRRLSQAQAVAVREDIKDAFMRIRATLLSSSGSNWDQQGDQEKTRISREEDLYKQEVIRLEKDLSDLESSVEGLRGEVINRRTRVNMAAVEDMALVLSRASKTVAELKMRFPALSNGVRNILSNEMEKVVREEKFLKEEPDRLESALRRCKKLTGTLVTLKRLASVQEQRLPPNEPPANDDQPRSADITTGNKPIPSPRMGPITVSGGVTPENALDALLDELQTFAKPVIPHNDFRPDDSTSDDSSQAILSTVTTQIPQACLYNPSEPNAVQPHDLPDPNVVVNVNMLQVNSNVGNLRRLHSYPSGSDTDTSPPQPARLPGKPPVPERNVDLLTKVGNKRIPPPPPPRSSSRSPLASPTSPNVPHRMLSLSETDETLNNGGGGSRAQDGSGNSSGNDSGNDQAQRQVALERRHQELLRKQKMLQEQYQRLQQKSKIPSVTMPPTPADILHLKKVGSESNLPQKMGLCMTTVTGSMKNLNTDANATLIMDKNEKNLTNVNNIQQVEVSNASASIIRNTQTNQSENTGSTTTTIKQLYETEII